MDGATALYMDEVTRIVFTPLGGELEENSDYAVVVTNDIRSIYGIQGCAPCQGDPLCHLTYDYVSYFSTGGFLSYTVPGDGDIGVHLDSVVEVRFSSGVYADSITQDTLFLRDDAGRSVACSLSYDPSTCSAYLIPAEPLQADTRYICSARTGIVSADSRRVSLRSDYSFSFVTASGFVLGFEVT
jgi:hypothetical protein